MNLFKWLFYNIGIQVCNCNFLCENEPINKRINHSVCLGFLCTTVLCQVDSSYYYDRTRHWDVRNQWGSAQQFFVKLTHVTTMTEQDIEMYEINEEVVEVMDVQLTDEVDKVKYLICESIDQMGLQRLEKGIQSFIHQCQTLGRVDLIDFIESNKSKPLHVHKTCRQKWRKSYSKTTKRASTEEVGKLRSTRKSSVNRDLATTCFFCDQSVAASKPHDIRHVSTMTIDDQIAQIPI